MNLLGFKFVRSREFSLYRMRSLGGHPSNESTFMPNNCNAPWLERRNCNSLIDDVSGDDYFATIEQVFGVAERNFERRIRAMLGMQDHLISCGK